MQASCTPTSIRLGRFLQLLRARAKAVRHQPGQAEERVFCPKRAENVRLIGPMTESAFATQPWLVERGGKFLQLTELLYRITELADGTRSIHQIALDASAATATDVPVDFVRQMIESRLVPVGIISGPPGTDAPKSATAASAGGSSRSPLALNMRMAVVSPRLIDGLTRMLQYLYAPPVLLLLLFVIVQSQYWLLFVHGIAAGVSQAFNTPSVLPVALALIVGCAAFHELGHAAALRYGGGQVRGMGVGLYLMYPAFYTDVTDNYRLGRWARVRTDLGGFYFNLLFSLALMGIYHLTGQEFLLLVALLTDIEIVHQCLPFVRLDGYWALADLTGIPDFFSFMGAYLRSVVPGLGRNGRKLPELKWWAKAVFGLYIAVAVPTIAILLFATVKSAPRVMSTAFESAHQQMTQVALAEANGDALGAAGSEAQLLLLLLPALGLAVMVASLGRAFASALWRWGKQSRSRRFASGLIAAGVGALFLFLWVPGLSAGDPNTYAALLNRVRGTLHASAAEPITASDGGTIPQAVAAIPAVPFVPPIPSIRPTETLSPTPGPTLEKSPGAGSSPQPTPEPTRPSAAMTAMPPTSAGDSTPAKASSQGHTVATQTSGKEAVQSAPANPTQADPTRAPVAQATDTGAVDPTRGPVVKDSPEVESSATSVGSGISTRTVSTPPTESAVQAVPATSAPTPPRAASSPTTAAPVRASTVQTRSAQPAAPAPVSTVPAARATPTPAQNSTAGSQSSTSGAQPAPTAQLTPTAAQASPTMAPAISPVASPATN